jgi:MHS family proline/betaine transporter-like MFS transporter
MVQGFSAGGEFGSATAMLIEQDPQRRGLYASMQWASSGFAVFLASMLAFAVNSALTPEQVTSWGWRLPFFFGLLIGPVAWYIRNRVDESGEYQRAERTRTPLQEAIRFDSARMLLGAGIVAAGAAGSFMSTYMPTFATTRLGLAPSAALVGTIVAGIINSVLPLAFGHASDRVGRVPVMATFGVVGLLMTYPMFQWLVASPSIATLVAIQAMLAFVLYCGYYATAPALLADLFETRRRVVGVSIAYVLGQLAFGGVTPLAVSAIVRLTGDPTSPGLYLSAIIVVSLACLWGCRRVGIR